MSKFNELLKYSNFNDRNLPKCANIHVNNKLTHKIFKKI